MCEATTWLMEGWYLQKQHDAARKCAVRRRCHISQATSGRPGAYGRRVSQFAQSEPRRLIAEKNRGVSSSWGCAAATARTRRLGCKANKERSGQVVDFRSKAAPCGQVSRVHRILSPKRLCLSHHFRVIVEQLPPTDTKLLQQRGARIHNFY